MAVGASEDPGQRDAAGLDDQIAFHALFAPIDRERPATSPPPGCFRDASVDREVGEQKPDDPVLEPVEQRARVCGSGIDHRYVRGQRVVMT